jgi:hypothetical protein
VLCARVVNVAVCCVLYWTAGSTYNPDQGVVEGLPSHGLDHCLSCIAEVCAVCNESKLDCAEGVYKNVGAPTEASLKVGCGSCSHAVRVLCNMRWHTVVCSLGIVKWRRAPAGLGPCTLQEPGRAAVFG